MIKRGDVGDPGVIVAHGHTRIYTFSLLSKSILVGKSMTRGGSLFLAYVIFGAQIGRLLK